MEKLETAWDFVVKYYPNYDSCEIITHSNDLQKKIDDIIEPMSLMDTMIKNKLHVELHCVNYIIYEKAIETYIEQWK